MNKYQEQKDLADFFFSDKQERTVSNSNNWLYWLKHLSLKIQAVVPYTLPNKVQRGLRQAT